MIAIIMLIRIMFTTTENTKKIQAAISSADLRAPKLNLPMLIAKVFCKVLEKSLKLSKSFLSTKKKKAEKAQKTMANSTTKVLSPMKQSRIVAEICMKALLKLINLEIFRVEVNTVKARIYS